ncbi:MAG: metallophosphoesterase [Christensenellales bacterium]|jgi:predicted phosphohydrolase
MDDTRQVYAIGDLHLPGLMDKSMDMFGSHWENHFEKIKNIWMTCAREQDIILIPGDISWAMRLEDAKEDLVAIGRLPGIKVMIRGNHDYWWKGLTRVRAELPSGMHALQHDALEIGEHLFAGARGWERPENENADAKTEKIYRRELIRLEMSLEHARKIDKRKRLIALCHYPPTDGAGSETPVTELMTRFGVSDVVYGHLHGYACAGAFNGEVAGVRYHCVSCDCIGFELYRLPETGG